MQRITADSNVEEVMANIGVGPKEKLRESEKREMMLRKFAQMRSRNPNVSLTLQETPTAFVEADEELDEFVDITVTTKQFEQKETNLAEKYHDYILQKAFCAHEVGHVLYSSWPALEEAMEQVAYDEMQYEGVDEEEAESYKLMFQNFANVLEDGAIENYLSKEFRLNEEIVHLRSTIHEDQYFGQEYKMEDGPDEYHYPFFFAVMTAALNLGVYDNGELDKLLDENNEQHIFAVRGGEVDREMFIQDVIPLLRSHIPKIHAETIGPDRMWKIYDLWDEIRKYIDRSQTSGRIEFEQQQNQAESDSYMDGVPENMSEPHGEQESECSGSVAIDSGDEEAEENESGQSFGEAQGDRDETSHENEGGGSESELEDKAQEGLIAETKQESGDWSDEVEEIINALGAGEGVEEIAIAEDGPIDESRLQEAERLSKRTKRLFARKLRHLNKDKVVRGKERGEFDSRALIPAERGSTRTFKQIKKGEDKNYSCMIVVDRSGSMSGNVKDVELAVGAISWGLEENGVDTCILDTESSMTTLSKPFGTSTDSFKKKIFAGRCSGGTPLTGTMKFARQRMKRGQGDYPFAIVITDGCPSSVSAFKDEVAKANFPVLGLYMTNNKSGVNDQLSLYDKAVTCTGNDDINQRLINLINNIIF